MTSLSVLVIFALAATASALVGNDSVPRVWLTVSSLAEKTLVNGVRVTNQRKIELNWKNVPDSDHWIGLFDKDPDSIASPAEEAIATINPPTLYRGRYK